MKEDVRTAHFFSGHRSEASRWLFVIPHKCDCVCVFIFAIRCLRKTSCVIVQRFSFSVVVVLHTSLHSRTDSLREASIGGMNVSTPSTVSEHNAVNAVNAINNPRSYGPHAGRMLSSASLRSVVLRMPTQGNHVAKFPVGWCDVRSRQQEKISHNIYSKDCHRHLVYLRGMGQPWSR